MSGFKISIITINYNNKDGLLSTVKSVLRQSYTNIEYIIVDGDSTDGSKDIIKQFQKHFAQTLIEKDEGIYDAMNKGLQLATGDFVLMLNSSDLFCDSDIITGFTDQINTQGVSDAIYFGRALVKGESHAYHYPDNSVSHSNLEKWLRRNVPNHQAMLFPKSFYSREKFDVKIKISADYDYKMRAIRKLPFFFWDRQVVEFELGGVSSSYANRKILMQMNKESWRNYSKYHGYFYAVKRVLANTTKYTIAKVFGSQGLYSIISKYRSK